MFPLKLDTRQTVKDTDFWTETQGIVKDCLDAIQMPKYFLHRILMTGFNQFCEMSYQRINRVQVSYNLKKSCKHQATY